MAHNTIITGGDSILDAVTDGIFTVDHDFLITSFNRAAEALTGIGREDAIRKPCRDIIRSSMCNGACPLRRTIETGIPISVPSASILRKDGVRIPVTITTAALHKPDGAVSGGVETIRIQSREPKARRGTNSPGESLSLREIESLAIVDALRRNRGNKTAAARELMIERSTLYRKIRDYGISETY